MKIAHISDIHIRLASRHGEYRHVIDNLVEDLKEQKPDLIVNTGDTVHNKVHLSPEIFSTMRYLYSRLVDIAPNIIIDGNHDMNVSNERRMSSVSAFVEIFNDDKDPEKQIIYFADSGVNEYKNIEFYLYPMVGNELPDVSKINKSKINIALYHGIVGGAKTDTKHKFKKEDQKIDIPHEKFDAVMLGDIHKHQFLKDNMAYPSSLIQQGWGELPYGHGYIMWEFNDSKVVNKLKSTEFREISNLWGYYKIAYADGEILSDYDTIPPNATIKVSYDSGVIRDDVLKVVQKRYGDKRSIILEEKIYDSEGKQIDVREDIVDVHNYATQSEIMSEYFDGDEHKSEILELNKKIFDEEKHKFDNDSMRISWVPQHIEFSNLFVYGENNIFVFDNKSGVIGLFSPNTSGKSSFLDAIQFAIYGETARTSTYDDIINKQSDKYHSIIHLVAGPHRFSIERSGKRTGSGWTNSLVVTEYDEEGNTVESEANMAEAKKIIEKYFGDAKSYQKTSYIYQDSDERFLNLTPAKRKEWLYDNLGLEVFEILHASAKAESKDLRNKIQYLEDKGIKDQREELMETKSEHDKALEKLDTRLGHFEEKMSELSSEYEVINNSKFHIDEDIVDVSSDIARQKNNLGVVENEKRKLEEEIKSTIKADQNLYEELQSAEEQLKELRAHGVDKKLDEEIEKENKIAEVIQEGKEVASNIKGLKEEIEERENRYSPEVSMSALQEKIKRLHEKKDNLKEKEFKMSDLKEKIEKSEKQAQILSKDDRFENENLCKTCPLLFEAFESKNDMKNHLEMLENLKVEMEKMMGVPKELMQAEELSDEMETNKRQIEKLKGDLQTNQDRREDLLSWHKQLTADLKSISERKKELIESRIETAESKIQTKNSEIQENIRIKMDKIEDQISDKKIEIQDKKIRINELQKAQEKFEEQKIKIQKNNEIDDQLVVKKAKIDELKDEIKDLNDQIVDVKSDIKSTESKIHDLDEEYKELKKSKADYVVFEKYIDATHKNNIPLQVISNMLETIQNEINSTLSNVVDFKLKLFIEDDNVVCNIIDGRGEREASRLSGMERFVSNLAFRISISQIGNMSVSKLLSIDEGLSALDSTTSQEIPRLFDYLKTKFDNIFVVSHHESMRDMVDYNVEIDTSNTKSRIYEA